MQCNTVTDRCHGNLTNTKMYILSFRILAGIIPHIIHIGLGRWCQIGCPAKHIRKDIFHNIDQLTGLTPGCFCLFRHSPECFIVLQQFSAFFVIVLIPQCFLLRILLCIVCKQCIPLLFCLRIFLCDCPEVIIYILRNRKALFNLPAQILSKCCYIFNPQWFSMCRCLSFLRRASISDLCLYFDHRRSRRIRLCLLDGLADRLQIISVLYQQCLETKCLKPLLNILTKRNICIALNRNIVRII